MCIMQARKFDELEARSLFSALGQNTSLRSLLIAGKPLGPPSAAALGAALAVNSTLTELTVGDKDFGDEGLAALVLGGLGGNRGLVSLDLEYRNLGSPSALHLGDILGTRSLPLLQRLSLSRNSLASDHRAFGNLLRGIRTHGHLTSLDVSENGVSDEGGVDGTPRCGDLLSELSGHPTLEVLVLSGNAWGASAPIAGLVAGLPCLKTLSAAKCGLGKEGIGGIADTLALAPALTTLNLDENGCGPDGASALALALPSSPALKVLRLGSNEIGDDGALALAGSLQSATTVRLLDCSRNNISGECLIGCSV